MTQSHIPGPGWATARGLVPLGPATPVDGASALDRILILEALARYSWALDECRQDALEQCFTPDATWAANLMDREEHGPFTGAAPIAEWLAGSFVAMTDQRRHLFMNQIVEEQTGDTAKAWAMCLITGAQDEVVRPRCSGLYQFTLKKADGVWRIATLYGTFDAPW